MNLSTDEENKAIQCLHDFLIFFNKKDKDKILECLHYPHMAQSDNNDPRIYYSKEEMWSYIGFLLNKLETEEGWCKSTLDKVQVLNKSENAVQCLVEFNRRLKNDESYAKATGIWIATKKNNRWGLQIRTMIPTSGNISILAGANLKKD